MGLLSPAYAATGMDVWFNWPHSQQLSQVSNALQQLFLEPVSESPLVHLIHLKLKTFPNLLHSSVPPWILIYSIVQLPLDPLLISDRYSFLTWPPPWAGILCNTSWDFSTLAESPCISLANFSFINVYTVPFQTVWGLQYGSYSAWQL